MPSGEWWVLRRLLRARLLTRSAERVAANRAVGGAASRPSIPHAPHALRRVVGPATLTACAALDALREKRVAANRAVRRRCLTPLNSSRPSCLPASGGSCDAYLRGRLLTRSAESAAALPHAPQFLTPLMPSGEWWVLRRLLRARLSTRSAKSASRLRGGTARVPHAPQFLTPLVPLASGASCDAYCVRGS